MREILESYYGKEVTIVGFVSKYNNKELKKAEKGKAGQYIALSPVFLLDDNKAYRIDHIWCLNTDEVHYETSLYQGIINSYRRKDGSEDYSIGGLKYLGINPFISLNGVKSNVESVDLLHEFHAEDHYVNVNPNVSERNKSIIAAFENGELGTKSQSVVSFKYKPCAQKSWIANKEKDKKTKEQMAKQKDILNQIPLTNLRVAKAAIDIRMNVEGWRNKGFEPADGKQCFVVFNAPCESKYRWFIGKYDKANKCFCETGIKGFPSIFMKEIMYWQYATNATFSEKSASAGAPKANPAEVDLDGNVKDTLVAYKKASIYHDKHIHEYGKQLILALDDKALSKDYQSAVDDEEMLDIEKEAYDRLIGTMRSTILKKKSEIEEIEQTLTSIESVEVEEEKLEEQAKQFEQICAQSKVFGYSLIEMDDASFNEFIEPYDNILNGTTFWEMLIRNEIVRRDGPKTVKRFLTNDSTAVSEALEHLKKRVA